MSEELKPCPFCGKKKAVFDGYRDGHDGDERYFVYCEYCGAYGPDKWDPEEAIEAWNRRGGS